MNAQNKHIYEFGSFRLDPTEHLLLRDGQIVPLTPKVFETLLVLVENNGHVIDKDEFLQKVWSGSFVEEANLAKNVSLLRKILNENGSEQSYIETIPKHGYRFVAPVRKIESPNWSGKPDKSIKFTKKKIGLTAALLSLLVVFGIWQFLGKTEDAKPASAIKSIAVLPFKSLNADDDNYLGLGMTDALITKLGHLKRVIVRPTSVVRPFANQPQADSLTIGQTLRVEAVLEGSIQRAGDRVRVTVQLINVGDGRQIWADKFEEKLTDFFAMQDAIASRVANSLMPQLTGEEQTQLTRRGTNNPEAFQFYVRGRFFADQGTREGLNKAVELLNKAVELDSNYALAYAGLSLVYYDASEWHLPPREAMPKAKFYAEQTLRLDETLPEAHNRLGWVKMSYDWDFAGAESEFKRALELNPNHADAHNSYSWWLSGMGRHEQAIAEAKRVEELDPLAYPIAVFYFARDYDQTISQAKKNLEIVPNHPAVLQWFGLAYEQKGMYEETSAAFQKAREIDDTPDIRAFQARVYALSGKRSVALKILAELQELSKQRYVSPFFIAIVYAGLNEKDEAFAQLEKAYEDRSYWMTSLKVNPQLDSLRDDSRFQDLLRRVGLPQ